MMSKAGILNTSVVVFALSICAPAFAQDEIDNEAATPEAGEPAEPLPPGKKLFDILPRVIEAKGVCEVNNPDVGAFAPALKNKAYPFGSVIRTGAGSSAWVALSQMEQIEVAPDSELIIEEPEQGADKRVIRLIKGEIATHLRDNIPEGALALATPNAVCKNMSGRGKYAIKTEGNTEVFTIATVTGLSHVVGPQYEIPALRAANTVEIVTALDRSFSRLTGVSGDYTIVLENGGETPVQYAMSPRAVVKIWRENAPISGRLIVSTLVVGPTGIARHRFAYAEGRPDLTTGELITGEDGKAEGEGDDELLPQLLQQDTKKDAAPKKEDDDGAFGLGS